MKSKVVVDREDWRETVEERTKVFRENVKKAFHRIFPRTQTLSLGLSVHSTFGIDLEGMEEITARVEIYQEYDKPEVTHDDLVRISKAFGTKVIDLSDGRSEEGCETCDYGSSYGIEIKIKWVDEEALAKFLS